MHFFYFDFVENNSQHALPDIVGTPQRPLDDIHLRFAPFNDHEVIANEGRRRTYVHYRDQRRKVDDHIVILSGELEISFTSRSPDKAARIADAIADAFISNQIDLKFQMHRKGDEWLLARANELRSQAEAAEQAVVTFKNKNNIVAVDGKSLNERELVDASAQLVAAQQKTADFKARCERAHALFKNSSSSAVDIMAVTASSDLTSNATITKVRQKFADLNDQLTDMSRKYGSDYWAVNNLRTKMQDTVHSIQDEIRRSVEGYKSDYDLSLQSQLRLEDNLRNAVALSEKANVTQVKLRELEGTAQSLRTLSENYLQRATASQQTESIPFAEGGRDRACGT